MINAEKITAFGRRLICFTPRECKFMTNAEQIPAFGRKLICFT